MFMRVSHARIKLFSESIAASDVLKLFIKGNERCHTTDDP